MLKNNQANFDPFLGRRRGGKRDEDDGYMPKLTRAKAERRAAEAREAEDRKITSMANELSRGHKGVCPICNANIGRGISGHMFSHAKTGELQEWQRSQKSKIELTSTISTDQT